MRSQLSTGERELMRMELGRARTGTGTAAERCRQLNATLHTVCTRNTCPPPSASPDDDDDE